MNGSGVPVHPHAGGENLCAAKEEAVELLEHLPLAILKSGICSAMSIRRRAIIDSGVHHVDADSIAVVVNRGGSTEAAMPLNELREIGAKLCRSGIPASSEPTTAGQYLRADFAPNRIRDGYLFCMSIHAARGFASLRLMVSRVVLALCGIAHGAACGAKVFVNRGKPSLGTHLEILIRRSDPDDIADKEAGLVFEQGQAVFL
jgi:hypothetical protein